MRVLAEEAVNRFHSRYVVDATGCWVWTGTRVRDGYGCLSVKGKYIRAHRFAYELLVGPIPEGLTLDHLCRNRACVNPDHLEPATKKENTLRGFGPTAVNARKDACIYGHQYTPGNTYRSPQGERSCRTCQTAYNKRRNVRRRELNARRAGLPLALFLLVELVLLAFLAAMPLWVPA